MPVLEPKASSGHRAQATIKGVAVTFHLTPFGQKRLLDAGIVPGKKFPLALLADLAHQGHAWTSRSAAEKTGIHWVPQLDLNLEGDEGAERFFLACTDCGGYDDLHLVAWQSDGGSGAALHCPACRAAMSERFTLSIPLPLVSLAALAQLEAQDKIRADATVIVRLREALAADLSATWEAFRRQRAQRQTGFGFGTPGELTLG